MKRARDPGHLRAVVEQRDLTQRELARLVECTYGLVGFILSGQPTTDARARRLARVLRRPLDALFEDAPSSVEQSIAQQKAGA